MALDVNNICTDADLANQVGGASELNRINKDVAVRDVYRQAALEDALSALAARVPAVFDTMLSQPTQLKLAVCYRALHKMYSSAIAAEGDRAHTLSKNYEREYLGAIRGHFALSPSGAVSSGAGSFSFERR